MAANPSVTKRQKERNRQDKRREKERAREERRRDKAARPDPAGGDDPDIAGIIPGPQPPPEN